MTVDHRRGANGWTFDVLAAAFAIGFMILASTHISPGRDDRSLDALGYLLIVVAGGSLALCRRRPDIVVGAVTVVLGTYLLRHYVGGPIFITGWIGLFFLSWRSTSSSTSLGALASAIFSRYCRTSSASSLPSPSSVWMAFNCCRR